MAASFKKKVKIRHAGFTYHKQHEVMQPTGKLEVVWNKVMANRGDDVVLEVEQDYKDGLAAGAFWTSEFDKTTGVPKDFEQDEDDDDDFEEPEEISVDEASDEELVKFVKDNTIAVVLEVADTPARCERIKNAEMMATGNDPRSSLIAELDRRIEGTT